LREKIDLDLLVDDHGDYLFRYALAKVRNETVAQDLVQETYLAAIRALESYRGQSSARTWLTSILRHKIADHFRKQGKEITLEALGGDQLGTERFFSHEKGRSGFWDRKFRPRKWDTSPQNALENNEFYEILEKCLAKLPDKIESVFRFRELDGVDSREVRDVFNLSASNYWIIMHRARLSLRRCMEVHWFNAETA